MVPSLAPMTGLKRHHLSGSDLLIDLVKAGRRNIGIEVDRASFQATRLRVSQAFASFSIHIDNHEFVVVQEEPVCGMVHECPKPLFALA